jgi:hypothetical protein
MIGQPHESASARRRPGSENGDRGNPASPGVTCRARALRAWFLTVAAGGAVLLLRARSLRWGATDAELAMSLPGDPILPAPDLSATRAVTIDVGPADVWPWIAQLGQGRGGFYSYDALENLVGCGIHSADRIVADWQHVHVGDQVHLHPELALSVVGVSPGRALVLRGAVPMGTMKPPYDFTWSFVVSPGTGGSTRLVVRERYSYTRRWAALLVEPVELISFLMSQKMLRGIKERAERAVRGER